MCIPPARHRLWALDSKALCRSIRNLGKVDRFWCLIQRKLGEVLDHLIQDGDLILAQGAGSVSKLSRQLVERWTKE